MKEPKVGDAWFRFVEILSGPCPLDELGNSCFSKPVVEVHPIEFKVEKITPKGVWIKEASWSGGYKKFILLKSKKKYAHPSKDEALESFIKRKQSQIRIIKDQLEVAEKALELGKEEQRKQS